MPYCGYMHGVGLTCSLLYCIVSKHIDGKSTRNTIKKGLKDKLIHRSEISLHHISRSVVGKSYLYPIVIIETDNGYFCSKSALGNLFT